MEKKQESVDTEKKTPTTPDAGEEGNKSTEELLEEAQEKLEKTQDKLDEKTTQAEQLTVQLGKERKANKPLIEKPADEPKPTPPLDGGDDAGEDGEDDFDTKFEARRTKEKAEEYITRVNRVYDEFVERDDIEFDGGLDIEFRRLVNNMNLGDTDREVMKKFEVIYKGIKPDKKKDPKEEDEDEEVNIGDGGSEDPNKPKSGKVDWMAKKLNKFEQQAADTFPGGESKYREKKQRRSDAGEI